VLSPDVKTYEVRPGAKPFIDRDFVLRDVAPELRGQLGIQLPADKMADGTPFLQIEAPADVKLLVGYFRSAEPDYLQVAKGETDADAADIIQQAPSIRNAATIAGMPPVDVHVMKVSKGKQTLDMRGKGLFVILGVVPAGTDVAQRDARLEPTK
jgi:hypothetical protein